MMAALFRADSLLRLVVPVHRGTGIVAGSNCIFAPDPAVETFGCKLTAALVVQHSASRVVGFLLGAMDTGSLIRVVSLISPISIC